MDAASRRCGYREQAESSASMSGLRTWSIWFILTCCAVVASYLWLDRPIALLAHEYSRPYDLFTKLTYLPGVILPLVIIAFAVIALSALNGRPLAKLPTVAVLAAASLAIATAIKDQLKFAFGRTWPETWVRNNPSFIRDGVFGFEPFHGGPGYMAFPSGHITAIFAVMSVLWICYPRFRVLYALGMAAVAVALVAANFHFLGDVIAGGFLGVSTGWLTVAIWEVGTRQVRGEAPDSKLDS
jgi:membrane-associated phospholipid phosphatase